MRHALRIALLWTFVLGILLALPPTPAAEAGGAQRTIRLTPAESVATVDGAAVELDVPATIESGHTLVPLRFVGESLDVAVDWQADTKTVTLSDSERTVTLRIDEESALVDGEAVPLPAPARISGGRTLVPLRFVSEVLGATVQFDPQTKQITITIDMSAKVPPVARFTLSREVVRPGERVDVRDQSYHPEGTAIVEQSWRGLKPAYDRAGRYEIGLRVKDANGNWSSEYVRELVVNTPPEARFRMEKSRYKIGEPVEYINESRDADGHKLTYRWTNQEPAFFEAGEHRVILEAEDPLGGKDTCEVTVTVTDTVHYTRTEYYLLYGEPKKVIPFEDSVLDYPVLELPATERGRILIKSNSPEQITSPGLLYQDAAAGPVRLMWHHLNKTGQDLKIYALAHNPAPVAVTVTINRQGLSRPSSGILQQGREYLAGFFNSSQHPLTVTIPPGQTVDLLKLGQSTVKPDFCVSGMADVLASVPLVFSFVAVPVGTDPIAALPELAVLSTNGQQIRGTYRNADRSIVVPADAAKPNTRLMLGDAQYDPPLTGIDGLTGREVSNRGNYGAVYEIVFEEIKAGTAVLLNPRGGMYCGAVRVNGSVWETPVERYLSPQREAVILHRAEESGPLRLEYSPPSGSYLPVNILLVRLPENKEEK